jgi:class 3 adenylate cyclase
MLAFTADDVHALPASSLVLLQVKPPGVSPTTTLVITDIEGSTTLFEELDTDVMDKAISLHHDTVSATY